MQFIEFPFSGSPTQVVLNAVAKVLLCSGRMPEALAFYRDAEVGGEWRELRMIEIYDQVYTDILSV